MNIKRIIAHERAYKKVILAIILILSVSTTYATDESEEWFTNGYPNGRWIDAMEGSGGDSSVVDGYFMGALDAIGDELSKLYPKMAKVYIVEAVKLFYEQNPTQKHRTIINVILSGCK